MAQVEWMSALKVNLWYGDTGSTKTSRLGDCAEYYAAKTGKPVRGIFSDTGGYDAVQGLVDDGTILPFILSAPARGEALIGDMDKLSKGWWPSDIKNAGSPLVWAPEKFTGLSATLVDGLTSWCQMMMTFIEGAVKYVASSDSMVATNVKSPEMPKDSYVRSGPDYIRRFTGRSDYGAVQGRIKEFVRNFAMLPVPVEATALETKGQDEGKRPIYGPDFIGQALTGVCGPWFGNLIHLDLLPQEKEATVGGRKIKTIEGVPYIFTRPHVDPDDLSKVAYMAKTRIDKRLWSKVPTVMEADAKKFYQLIDSLAEEAKQLNPTKETKNV